MKIKTIFISMALHALSLTLKQRLMATWKWPTPQLMGKRTSIYIFRELGQIFW